MDREIVILGSLEYQDIVKDIVDKYGSDVIAIVETSDGRILYIDAVDLDDGKIVVALNVYRSLSEVMDALKIASCDKHREPVLHTSTFVARLRGREKVLRAKDAFIGIALKEVLRLISSF